MAEVGFLSKWVNLVQYVRSVWTSPSNQVSTALLANCRLIRDQRACWETCWKPTCSRQAWGRCSTLSKTNISRYVHIPAVFKFMGRNMQICKGQLQCWLAELLVCQPQEECNNYTLVWDWLFGQTAVMLYHKINKIIMQPPVDFLLWQLARIPVTSWLVYMHPLPRSFG